SFTNVERSGRRRSGVVILRPASPHAAQEVTELNFVHGAGLPTEQPSPGAQGSEFHPRIIRTGHAVAPSIIGTSGDIAPGHSHRVSIVIGHALQCRRSRGEARIYIRVVIIAIIGTVATQFGKQETSGRSCALYGRRTAVIIAVGVNIPGLTWEFV